MKPGTPLPWHVGNAGYNVCLINAGADTVDPVAMGKSIAQVYGIPQNTRREQMEQLVSQRPEHWAEGWANAAYIVHAANLYPELVEALSILVPPMPTENAPCHLGIVPQSKCCYCQRIAVARALLAKCDGAQ